MRPAPLRSGVTPFGRTSKVTAEFAQLRRIKVPEQPEVVAVHVGDDWFALFADEKDLASRAQTRPAKPTEITARETQPSIEAWEFARFAPEEDPPWLRRVLNWRAAPWSAIATGIVLSAGVLLVVARSLGGDGTSAATESTVASVPAETRTAAPPPVLTHSVAYAPATPTPAVKPAPRKEATRTKAAPPLLQRGPRRSRSQRPFQPGSDSSSSVDSEAAFRFDSDRFRFVAEPSDADHENRRHSQSRGGAHDLHSASRAFATQRLGLDSVSTGSLSTGV